MPPYRGVLQTQDRFDDTSQGDVERRQIAREAFLEQWLQHPSVRRFIRVWAKQTGLDKVAKRQRRATATLSGEALHATIESFMRRILRPRPRVGQAASRLVAEQFGEPVPWLVKELILGFVGALVAAGGLRSGRDAHLDQIPVPLVALGYPGDRKRTREAFRELEEKFHADYHAPTTRRPLKKRGSIHRNAVWFYRRFVDDVALQTLAREYHDEMHPKLKFVYECQRDDPLVSRGLRETARLLDLPFPPRRPPASRPTQGKN